MEYDRTNTIAIFKNKNKANDKAPDYKGRVNVDGVDKEISLWLNESKKTGEKYMSGTVQDPYNAEQKPAPRPTAKDKPSFDDEQIPF